MINQRTSLQISYHPPTDKTREYFTLRYSGFDSPTVHTVDDVINTVRGTRPTHIEFTDLAREKLGEKACSEIESIVE